MKTILLLLALSPLASAITTWTGSVDITGEGTWATGSVLTWEVERHDANAWVYRYTFDVTGKDISHVIIEACDEGQILHNGEQGVYDGTQPSNPNLPVTIDGVKWDATSDTKSFTFGYATTQAPSYGDFYAKSGRGTSAFSEGLVPVSGCDTVNALPEPSTALTFAFGGCLALLRRRK